MRPNSPLGERYAGTVFVRDFDRTTLPMRDERLLREISRCDTQCDSEGYGVTFCKESGPASLSAQKVARRASRRQLKMEGQLQLAAVPFVIEGQLQLPAAAGRGDRRSVSHGL